MRKFLMLAATAALLGTALAPAQAATSWVGTRVAHVPTVGGFALGVIGAAAVLTGYEALVCKTQHIDPLNMGCQHMSWRDPSWLGPNWRGPNR